MTRRLVFIHGRSQEEKDSKALKHEWISAWETGLAANGLTLPLTDSDITVPYSGDTLAQLTAGLPPQEAADVVLRGPASPAAHAAFVRQALHDLLRAGVITQAQVDAVASGEVKHRGVLQWEWVQTILAAVDRNVPGASSASVLLATQDVHHYLHNAVVQADIDGGVAQAMRPGVETVVVGHSLGSVVAYRMLANDPRAAAWQVPLFMTLGSPLAVSAIRDTLSRERPMRCPPCARTWFNAMDRRDIVALFALDASNLPLAPALPAIDNKTDVRNDTQNRHGISGYLKDPEVARRLHAALTLP